jgi:HlyD family secretion protein
MDEKHPKRRFRRLLLWGALIDLLLLILVAQQAGVFLLPTSVEKEALEASGIIQVTQISVSSEIGGRITAIPLSEGDSVGTGDVLVQLDTALLDAQIEAARAAVAWAEAGLAQARAGTRSGQIAVAEAQLAQAETARAAARQVVSDTLALVENPQDIRLEVAVTQAQVEAAQHEVARAIALKDAAEIAKNSFEDAQAQVAAIGVPGLVNIPLALHLTPNQWWQAWVGVNTAIAKQKGLQDALDHLYAQRANPQRLEAQVDEGLAALAQAQAQVAAARANLEGLKAGASPEQIAALEARAAQAQAGLDSLLAQRKMTDIVAPGDGVVLDVVMQPGEVAAPGAELLKVADLREVQLIVYLPETQIAAVGLGQPVQVKVDSFPHRLFEGSVTHISDRAEFTPRNVSTREERVNLVFAIEIRLPNGDGALKPGMPADALFAPRES